MEEKQSLSALNRIDDREPRCAETVAVPKRPSVASRYSAPALQSHSFDIWLDRELKTLGQWLGAGTPDDLINLIRNSRRLDKVD
jgi:hypothetical protein